MRSVSGTCYVCERCQWKPVGLCHHIHASIGFEPGHHPSFHCGLLCPYQLVCGKLEHVQPDLWWWHSEQACAVHEEVTLPRRARLSRPVSTALTRQPPSLQLKKLPPCLEHRALGRGNWVGLRRDGSWTLCCGVHALRPGESSRV